MFASILLSLALFQGNNAGGASTVGSIAPLVESGIRRGVYPGAVVVVGRRDTVLYARSFGHLSWARTSPVPSVRETRWDLASLTKVVATASSAMVLVDEGKLALDAPVSRYLPKWNGGGRELVTVRMLLDHTSGLRAYLPFYRLARTRDSAVERLFTETPVRIPGLTPVYSDLNAILLGLVVEAVSGETLDVFAGKSVFAPLHLTSTAFMPSLRPGLSIAPSWSSMGKPLPGRVNDDNANLFGGVSGHAGLFSTGADLARFAQAWLREGKTAEGPWVSTGSLKEFLRRTSQSGSRALGWDTPEQGRAAPSIYGALAGANTFGHTGWTGTMMWVDPTRNLFLVFLTNRSLEPRTRRSLTAMHTLRASLSDLVIQAFQH